MSDRDFWLLVRAALLGIVSAIERKYIGKNYRHFAADGSREILPAGVDDETC